MNSQLAMPWGDSTEDTAPTADAYEWLLNSAKKLLTTDEVIASLRLSRVKIRSLGEEGDLERHVYPAARASGGADEQPVHRYTRAGVLAYLLATANYNPKRRRRVMAKIAEDLSEEDLEWLVLRLSDQCARRRHAREFQEKRDLAELRAS